MRRIFETTGALLRRCLPPTAFQHARYLGWILLFYFPRLAAARFHRRTPQLHLFPETSPLARLSEINLLAPTEMCRRMTWHGSDKGERAHNYTTIYSALLADLRDRPLRIFELGIGTNNPTAPSNMGRHGRPGASLRAWRDLFPQAAIFGADVDPNILFHEDRIQTFHCDQQNPASIAALWSHPNLREGMDLIIDDGLHDFQANAAFLEISLHCLRPGGIYIVEDITADALPRWHNHLSNNHHPNHHFALLTLPNPANNHDNNLLLCQDTRPSRHTAKT